MKESSDKNFDDYKAEGDKAIIRVEIIQTWFNQIQFHSIYL